MRVPGYIALFFCLCCIFSRAYAETTPARILVGSSEVPLAPSPVYDGTRVLAPMTILERLGATGTTSRGGVSIVAASGDSGTVRTVDVDGRQMLPMDRVMEIVGGDQIWDARSRTLTLLARLDSVEFDTDTLKINSSFPVHSSVKTYGGKLLIDVMGTKLATEAKEVYIGTPTVDRARLGQLNATTSRVVLEFSKQTGYDLQTKDMSAQILVRIADDLTPIPPADETPEIATSVTINGVTVQTVDARSFDVVISTDTRTRVSKDYSVTPPRIVIGIPKARIGEACTVNGSHSLVSADLSKTPTGAKLTLALTKPLDYTVETAENQIVVHVRPLLKSGGTLAGKVVLLDPGHGGKQKGACAGGAMEKNVNMQIAKDVAAALVKQGARVILSRDSDIDKGLAERARTAINQGADFFIALHCNSNLVAGSATGIETYYHFEEPSPKTLATFIHDGVCKYTGMCDRRARSDLSLHYTTGLGVLRTLSGSGVPGILVECGYINNPTDRAKLLDATYRSKIASGIVAGLKAYIGDGSSE